MDVYRTEEEQVEALKKWWAENGKSVVFGVLLGLGAIFGWREWRDYTAQQAAAASQLYQEMIVVMRDKKSVDKAKQTAQLITDEYGSTTYAVFANMALAKLAVGESDYEGAAARLRWALENSETAGLEHVNRLRLARVLAAQEKYADALKLLDQTDTGQFGAGYDELRGDIMKRQGELEAARGAYEQALIKRRNTAQSDISVLEMKLDDLGHTEIQ